MFLRIDKLPVELPQSTKVDPASAAAVQELMGGRFGEMSTFNNYLFQSMNMRGKKQLGPYYELVANIAAEELGHIQLVGAAINSLLNGPEADTQEDDDEDRGDDQHVATFLGAGRPSRTSTSDDPDSLGSTLMSHELNRFGSIWMMIWLSRRGDPKIPTTPLY